MEIPHISIDQLHEYFDDIIDCMKDISCSLTLDLGCNWINAIYYERVLVPNNLSGKLSGLKITVDFDYKTNLLYITYYRDERGILYVDYGEGTKELKNVEDFHTDLFNKIVEDLKRLNPGYW